LCFRLICRLEEDLNTNRISNKALQMLEYLNKKNETNDSKAWLPAGSQPTIETHLTHLNKTFEF
jgi:hypothetical protein